MAIGFLNYKYPLCKHIKKVNIILFKNRNSLSKISNSDGISPRSRLKIAVYILLQTWMILFCKGKGQNKYETGFALE